MGARGGKDGGKMTQETLSAGNRGVQKWKERHTHGQRDRESKGEEEGDEGQGQMSSLLSPPPPHPHPECLFVSAATLFILKRMNLDLSDQQTDQSHKNGWAVCFISQKLFHRVLLVNFFYICCFW